MSYYKKARIQTRKLGLNSSGKEPYNNHVPTSKAVY